MRVWAESARTGRGRRMGGGGTGGVGRGGGGGGGNVLLVFDVVKGQRGPTGREP